jgi:hypothetical protein
MSRQQPVEIFQVLKKRELENMKKYRIEIQMIKPYEIVDYWPRKPVIDNVIEAFIDELFTLDSRKYFKLKVSEVQDDL